MIRVTLNNICSLFKETTFYIGICIYVMILYLRTLSESVNHDVGLYYFLNFMTKLEGIGNLLIVVACFPLVTFYNYEWNSGFALFKITRLGRHRFLISQLMTVVMGSFLTVVISLIVYSGLILISHPLVGNNQETLNNLLSMGGFREYLFGNNLEISKFYFILFLQKGIEVSFYSLITLVCSIIIRDGYLISVLPILWYNVFNMIEVSDFLPPIFGVIFPQYVIGPEFIYERVVREFFPMYYNIDIVIWYPLAYLLVIGGGCYLVMWYLSNKTFQFVGKKEVLR